MYNLYSKHEMNNDIQLVPHFSKIIYRFNEKLSLIRSFLATTLDASFEMLTSWKGTRSPARLRATGDASRLMVHHFSFGENDVPTTRYADHEERRFTRVFS